MADEREYLPLAVVAERTGISVRSLREWCATGRLDCERFGGTWSVRAADIDDVRDLASRRSRPPSRTTFVLPAEVSTPAVEAAIARALGHTERHVAKARLTIDAMEYVAFTADADPEAIEAARTIVERQGGQLLDP